MLDKIQHAKVPVLISFSICPFVQRSAILLEEKQQPYERINIDLANKPEWFLQLSPTGRVPALVVKDDNANPTTLFESAVINEYLDEAFGTPLLVGTSLEKASMRAWISYSETLIGLQYKLMLATQSDDFAEKLTQFVSALKKLKPAPGKPFFNGVAFSLVDVAIAPVFTRLKWLPHVTLQLQQEAKNQPDSAALLNWINHLSNYPAVKQSVSTSFDTDFVNYFKQRDSFALN